MKKFLSLWLLTVSIFVINVSAQQLTIEQAVLQTGMRPSAPQYMWGGPDGGYLQVKNGAIFSTQAKSGKESVLITREELNAVFQASGLPALPSLMLPQVLAGSNFRFRNGNAIVDFDWSQKKVVGTFTTPKGSENLVLSPSGTVAAYTSGQNIFLANNSGKETRVTNDLAAGIVNGQTVSRNEFGISSGLFWSPKGTMLAFYRKDESKVTEYPLVNITTTPASTEMDRYPMAGSVSESIQVGIYNVSDGSTIFLKEDAFGYDRYFASITWDPSEFVIYAAVLNREQNHMLLNQYDARTGLKIRTMFEEKSDKYVEPLNPLYFNPGDPSQFIWISERGGFSHMYLYRNDGTLIRQLSQGEWVVTEFLGWDRQGKTIYFRSTDPSPLERRIYKLELNSGLRQGLTPEPGTHDAMISPDGRYIIDSYSSYEVPRRIILKEIGAKESRILFDATNPLANIKIGKYRSFTIKAADKKTDLYGYMVLPPDMDSTKKYPVVVYVYGGPHAQLVLNTWMGGASGWQHYMAQQGYIAMTLDNRGSDARGRDFEQIIHRNLGKAEMADQMEGINYLFSLPFVDTNRVGVHGWSFGGFMTISLMLNYPDIFKVGVAGGPVTDWKYYEVMYGERYMDMPSENQDGYELSSTLNRVKNLRGRLMLIHGDIDNTVVWQNSLMFLRKCIDEGKLVDYMIYPQHPHNVRGNDRIHLMRTVTRYFQDNL